LKIAILGTRGIPNNYGGFEQFAEYVSVGLVARGCEVYVYSPHNHPFKGESWEGVHIIHQFDPEYQVGTAGQFIYDLRCILDSRKRKFDVILQLGYTSSSVWNFLIKTRTRIVTNMDGLEWKRTKYGPMTQQFLKYAERVAVRRSDHLISDSLGIRNYLKKKYKVESEFIPYGAFKFSDPDPGVLSRFSLRPYQYNMLIARLEPENSIETILDGVVMAKDQKPMLVIANYNTKYGKYLVRKYNHHKMITFFGPLYEIIALNNLRYFSNLYFHGHTVGGTNPSLLEAMASHALVAASMNEFNYSVLESDAYYFSTSAEVATLLGTVRKTEAEQAKIQSNLLKIQSKYSWDTIIESYYTFFQTIYKDLC
jgi:glycosyltransferase involved in cell wall biosynthesis